MRQNIAVGNKKYILSGFYGEVVNQQNSAEGYSNRGSDNEGWYNHSRIYSTKEFFLISPNGEEQAFSFTDKPIPSIRPGHIVQVMWLHREKQEYGRYIFVRNVTLNENYFDEEKVREVYTDAKTKILLALIMPLIGLSAASVLITSFLTLITFITGKGPRGMLITIGVIGLSICIFFIIYQRIKMRNHFSEVLSEVLKRSR